MTATAPERNFTVFPRGEIRDEILTSFRYGLRQIDNPDTGVAFSETEIATATARLSRFWIEADAIDLVLLTVQNRDLFFADQARPDRANHEFLTNYHGVLWDVAKLEASGGSGQVLAPATTGTIFTGSTTIPDAAAIYGTDPQGLRFQVLFTATATAGGITINGEAVDGATLQIKGIDTGPDTNLAAATEIKWANAPPGAPAPAIVDSDDFTGGFGDETDAEFARRILTAIREKEGAGNNPEMRAWAKSASTAVEDAFIYACALHAGSVRVAIVQKRGDVEGPTGREPAVGTLTDVTAYLTPPASPVVPTPPAIVVTGFTGIGTDLTLGLSLPSNQSSGWEDLDPWPTIGTGADYHTEITALTSQTVFQITIGTGSDALPSGVTAPSLMAWDRSTSRWEKLKVQSVTLNAGLVYDVVLTAAPTLTLEAGATPTWISPDTERRVVIAEAIEAYLDTLGPGELVESIDNRYHRAYRYPQPAEEYPQRAGTAVTTYLQNALGSSLTNATLTAISTTTPSVPTDPVDPPEMIVANDVGIYPE